MTGTEQSPPTSGPGENGEEVLGGPAHGTNAPDDEAAPDAAEQARRQADEIAEHRTRTGARDDPPRRDGQRGED
jgi:hypothetical protein